MGKGMWTFLQKLQFYNRDIPLNCNDIVNYFIAICKGDHSITKSLLSTLYCKSSTVFAVFSHSFASNYNIIAIQWYISNRENVICVCHLQLI